MERPMERLRGVPSHHPRVACLLLRCDDVLQEAYYGSD